MTDEQNIIIYRTADGRASVALYAKDGKIWLNQQQMAELFATSKPNISMHIANILKEKELNEVSVVKNYLTTAADGKNYNVVFWKAYEMYFRSVNILQLSSNIHPFSSRLILRRCQLCRTVRILCVKY